jgi:hypothetical protein
LHPECKMSSCRIAAAANSIGYSRPRPECVMSALSSDMTGR